MRLKQCSLLFTIILISLPAAWICVSAQVAGIGTINYPSFKADPTKNFTYNDTYWEPDPYNALEKDGPVRTKWMDDMNEVSRPPIRNSPTWKQFNSTFASIWSYQSYESIACEGPFFYATVKNGLENQAVIYQLKTATDPPTTEFLNLNKVDPTGQTSLVKLAFSRDATQFVYSISIAGSDWVEVKTMSTNPIKNGTDCLKEVRYSELCWHPNGQGFFYCRYKGANITDMTTSPQNHTVWYHKLGTNQSEDVQCIGFPGFPDYRLWPEVSKCGKYLLVAVLNFATGDPGNAYYYAVLDGQSSLANLTLKPIITKFDDEFYYIFNIGTIFIFRTNRKAPNWRLIRFDINNPDESKWEHVVPEQPSAVMTWAMAVAGGRIICHYTQNMTSVLQVHAADTGQKVADIPVGIVQIVDGQGDFNCSKFIYKVQAFGRPGTISMYDTTTLGPPQVIQDTKINLPGFDPNNYKADLVYYNSTNNTQVGMYIVKNANMTGPMPCLLRADGAFKMGVLPYYGSTNIIWMNKFGILACPGIRGGNEKGDNWWRQGILLNRQSSYDDCEAAIEYLVLNNHTTYAKIVLWGIPTAVLINQIPNKIGCAIVENIIMLDQLRYTESSILKEFKTDYGDPQWAIYYPLLRVSSPYHNIFTPTSSRQYPPILALGGKNDRVPPSHLCKWYAKMSNVSRNNPNQKNPILCIIYPDVGSNSQSTKEQLEYNSDLFTFIKMAVAPTAVF